MNRALLPIAAAVALAAVGPALAVERTANLPAGGGPAMVAPMSNTVTAVQQRLTQLGYNTATTGTFDANLRNNVLRFQADHGLRPTGEVDLYTLSALGIEVEPRNMAVAAAPAQAPMRSEGIVAEIVQPPPAYRQPLLRDEHMNSPQVRDQVAPFENFTGVPVPRDQVERGQIAGLPPGYPLEDLNLYSTEWQ